MAMTVQRRRPGPGRSSPRKRPFARRVAEVASAYALLGAFAGGMLALFLGAHANPMAGSAAGAVVGTFVGGLLEAVYG